MKAGNGILLGIVFAASCTSSVGPIIESYFPSENQSRVYESEKRERVTVETKFEMTVINSLEMHSWTTRFPSETGEESYLSLLKVDQSIRLVAIGVGHGAMAPNGDLTFLPAKLQEGVPWSARFRVQEGGKYEISLEGGPVSEKVVTREKTYLARRIEINLHAESGSIPLIKLWYEKDHGFVRFDNGRGHWDLVEEKHQ